MPVKHRLALAVVAALLLGLVGWRLSGKLSQGAGPRQRPAPVVSVTEVTRRDLERSFESVGTVESPQRVDLSPKVSGRIEWLEAQVGDRVRQGELLVKLDAGDLEDQVNQRRAELAEATSRLAQARMAQAPAEASVASELRQQQAAVTTARADLTQTRQSAQASIQSAQAGVDNARAEAANAQARLKRTESLYQQAFTAAQDVDDARTAAAVAQGHLTAAQEALRTARARATADVAAAEARLQQARAALDYAQANTAQTSAYAENLQALKSIEDAAAATLASAQTRLGDVDLHSPLDGYVTARLRDVGSLAQPGQPILTLQSTRDLWVTVQVPEEIRQSLAPTTKARIEFDAEGVHPVDAKLLRLNAAADPESRQFEVRVLLPQSSQARPGMFARVHFQTQRASRALAVPRSAIRTTPDGPVALVVQDGKVRVQPVSLGLSTPEYQQVLDGLKQGERVVTLGDANLEDGQEVRLEGERPKGGKPGEGSPGGARPDGATPAGTSPKAPAGTPR